MIKITVKKHFPCVRSGNYMSDYMGMFVQLPDLHNSKAKLMAAECKPHQHIF